MNISRSAFSEHRTMRVSENCSFEFRRPHSINLIIGNYPYFKSGSNGLMCYRHPGKWALIGTDHTWSLEP